MTTKRALKGKKYRATPEVPPETAEDGPTGAVWQKEGSTITVNMVVASPAEPWLQVTSMKTGTKVCLPLPIRLIRELRTKDGKPDGCIVRGAHGDESTATESVSEILGILNGYRLGSHTEWSLAE